MKSFQKKIRILEIYAVVSLLILAALTLSAFTQSKQTVDELTVQRLNVVEKNGQLVTVIANSDRMPDPIINGKAFKVERPPGMIFYNGLGDECGGLIYGAVAAGNKYGAYGGFTLDQYKQSQAIGLIYNDHTGSRQVGLSVWDRPEIPLSDLMQRREAVNRLREGPEKESAKRSLREAEFSPTRIFVGKNKEREAKITLYDAKGNPRINMIVDAAGIPRLDFLNESGRVTYSLPAMKSSSAK